MYNYLKEEKNVYWGYTEKAFLKTYVNKKPNPLKTKLTIACNFQCWGARAAQWWEHSPSSRVTRVRILASLNLLLVLSFALSVFFSGYSGFPLSLKTNTFKFQFDMERMDTFQRVLLTLFNFFSVSVFKLKYANHEITDFHKIVSYGIENYWKTVFTRS